MSTMNLTPVDGQVDTFNMTATDGQPITAPAAHKNGKFIGCTETITLVHHIKDEDDTYTCHTVGRASWFSKQTITTDGNGAKPVNTYEVRILSEFSGVEPALGDYVVKGIAEGIEKPADLKNTVHFRITAIGDNRRGKIPHWRVSGQ